MLRSTRRIGESEFWSIPLLVTLLLFASISLAGAADRVDRRALVARHDIRFDQYTPQAPASLGNGHLAFTFDVTGLQTFPSDEPGHLPLCTMSDWSWHRFPQADEFRYEETLREYTVNGQKVSYATDMQSETAKYFRANPHRFNLGRIALRLIHPDGSRAKAAELENPEQVVSLWKGEARSTFSLDGESVEVTTVVHPTLDAVALSVKSALIPKGLLSIELTFPYPAGEWGPKVDDWSKPHLHTTEVENGSDGQRLRRLLDSTEYVVKVASTGNFTLAEDHPHTYYLQSDSQHTIEAVICFQKTENSNPAQVPSFQETRERSNQYWQGFWNQGGIVDLSQSADDRWRELERRIVLSQFLTAIHSSGAMPPQETGLLCNSWFGKAHLEMHWWHAAHFALWQRTAFLERSMDWYRTILPAAKRIALRQGYAGVRWPKMTGPEGISSPSEVGELLIWQQPHPIYFAELFYRAKPEVETLKHYQEIVEETANFMADYAEYDKSNDRYVLGPVLIPAQECYNGRGRPGVINPTFELAYWRWGLRTANEWRTRLGLSKNPKWQEVETKISRPHEMDGVYTAIENAPFTNRRDHPSMLAALGVLPDQGLIAPRTMSRTLDSVLADWDWPDTWGWDYPMMAMTAARLGRPDDAIDCLLLDTPKNTYLQNGHCRQEDRLPIYLPANGGLLTAIGMMCAGWDHVEEGNDTPGFPTDRWQVVWEDIDPMP